jgi:hypothetical protein
LSRWYINTNWTLSIILFLSKTPSSLYFKTQRLGDWILSRLQVKPNQLGQIDRARPYLRTPVPAPRPIDPVLLSWACIPYLGAGTGVRR